MVALEPFQRHAGRVGKGETGGAAVRIKEEFDPSLPNVLGNFDSLVQVLINLMFNAIADHMPDITSLGTPERLRAGWLNGIKHWQVDYTGKAPAAL